jgi:hypothetical protein
MPDRAIIPLLPALSLGFICGIVASTLQLQDTPTLVVGVLGALVVVIAGISSVFGVRAQGEEKAIVAALRAACAVGVFVAIYLFILGFLREGSVAAVIWLFFAIALGVVMSRIAVRDSTREEPSGAS